MKYKLDEYYIKMIKEASDLTRENYEIVDDFIDIEELFAVIETLIYTANDWKEKFEELENDLEENYRPIPYAEQVCVYDSDFI